MSDPLWTLPWHYLATPVCLLHRLKKPALLEQLKPMTQAQLAAILAPDQQPLEADPQHPQQGSYPSLMNKVRAIGRQVTTKPFDWDAAWPSGLALRLRRWDPAVYGAFILAPGALYLRYPFAEAIDGAPDIPWLNSDNPTPEMPSGTPDPTLHFYSEAFMDALDYFVDTPAGRAEFPSSGGALPSGEKALEKIVGRVYSEEEGNINGIPPPAMLKVQVEAEWQTYQTAWERYDNYFRLRLGWQPSGEKSAGGRLIYEWPCGAL